MLTPPSLDEGIRISHFVLAATPGSNGILRVCEFVECFQRRVGVAVVSYKAVLLHS